MSSTRRQLLGRGAAAAGTAALPGALLSASPAFAKATDETDATKTLISYEQAGSLAYEDAASVKGLDADAKKLLDAFKTHADDRDDALEAALDELGEDPPKTPASIDSVDILAGYAKAKGKQADLIDFFADFELKTIEAYLTAAADLDAEDLVRTGAQLAASHAQQLVALRLLRGDDPVKAATIEAAPQKAPAAG